MPKIIVLDPGHGSTRGAPGFDSGAVFMDRTEAEANLDAALTLKSLLTDRGYKVVLTHDGTDGAKPDLSWRIRMAVGLGAVCLVSLHYDQAFVPSRHRRGVYAAPGSRSMALAQALTSATCLKGGWCEPSSHSRFNGLYIDAMPDNLASVLVEMDSIEYAPESGPLGRTDRLVMLRPIASTIAGFIH
jgi:N-acetylmuramoyl-L-alanine amidase